MIDIPSVMRSTSQFRTTLGHKTNSAFFDERNAEFDTVRHSDEFFSNKALLTSLGAASSAGANSLCYS